MKLRPLLPALLALACAAAVAAQSTQTLTLSQPTQPATVNVSLFSGSITVRSGAAGVVSIVIATAPGEKSPLSPPAPAPPGMHLLNPGGALTATEANNVVTVRSASMRSVAGAVLQVPASTSLTLHTMRGDISVTGVSGELSAQTLNGDIVLNQVGGSVVAHALRGKIIASLTALGSKPSSFSSMNGDIDVTLPADAKANLRLQDDQGGVYLDNGFAFTGTAVKSDTAGVFTLPNQADLAKQITASQDAVAKAQLDMLKAQGAAGPLPPQPPTPPKAVFPIGKLPMLGSAIAGTLNGGGPEMLFQDFRGNIYLHKAK